MQDLPFKDFLEYTSYLKFPEIPRNLYLYFVYGVSQPVLAYNFDANFTKF